MHSISQPPSAVGQQTQRTAIRRLGTGVIGKEMADIGQLYLNGGVWEGKTAGIKALD